MQFHATRAETVLARLEAKHGRITSHEIRQVARLVIDQMQAARMTTATVAEAVLVAAVALREAADHEAATGQAVTVTV